MAKKNISNLLAALDVGTTKVVALIGEIDSENKLEIVGSDIDSVKIIPSMNQVAAFMLPPFLSLSLLFYGNSK